jgi:hypothetical protein
VISGSTPRAAIGAPGYYPARQVKGLQIQIDFAKKRLETVRSETYLLTELRSNIDPAAKPTSR